MDIGIFIIEAVLGLVLAAVVGYLAYRVGRKQAKDEGAVLRAEAERTLTEAQAKARELLVQNKDELLKLREEAEREIKERRLEVQREEERLVRRRSEVDSQRDKLEQREKRANQRQAQAVTEDHPLDARRARTERHADANLVGALRDNVGHHAVDTDAREHEGQPGKRREQHHDKPALRDGLRD